MSWGVFGKLLGTDKAVDNILDKDKGLLAKAGAWVGNMNLTDEERMENDLLVRQWGLKQLEALAPFKVVQRILAFAVAFMWIFSGLNVFAAIWVDYAFGTTLRADMIKFATSDFILWPVMAVFTLYFMGGVWKGKGK